MDAKTMTNDVKNEVTKGIEKLEMLRDEVKLHIHLASLDAKQEWNDKLEPRINEVSTSAQSATDVSKAAVHDLVAKVEGFYARIRGTKAS
jgi:hypothetical protein